MTDTDQAKKIMEIMERLRFFDAFSPLEKRKIIGLHAHFRVYQAGDVIIKEGSKGTAMFVLLSGTVKVSKGNDSRLRVELKPGDIFGEIAFLSDTDRTADVTAETVVIALELNKRMIFELDPPMREKVKDKIIEKLIQRLEHMNDIFFKLDLNKEAKASPHPEFSKSESTDFQISHTQAGSVNTLNGKNNSVDDMPLKKAILKNVKELPPMPEVLIKAQRTLADPASGPQQLARVLASDQAIAAKILKVANSAFYGFPGKIASIEKASALFGTDRLSQLLTNMSISGLPSKILKGYGMRSADLWQHALATAYGAKRVAETAFPEMAEDAYIAGLLHDSGKFILDACVFERKDRFKKHMTDTGCSFLEAEREILGFDHGEIAYAACNQWNIPEVIALAIRFHHNPTHPRSNLLAHLTHYANHLAIKTRIGACKESVSLKLDRTTRKIFDLKNSELKSILNTIRSDVNNTTQAVHT